MHLVLSSHLFLRLRAQELSLYSVGVWSTNNHNVIRHSTHAQCLHSLAYFSLPHPKQMKKKPPPKKSISPPSPQHLLTDARPCIRTAHPPSDSPFVILCKSLALFLLYLFSSIYVFFSSRYLSGIRIRSAWLTFLSKCPLPSDVFVKLGAHPFSQRERRCVFLFDGNVRSWVGYIGRGRGESVRR